MQNVGDFRGPKNKNFLVGKPQNAAGTASTLCPYRELLVNLHEDNDEDNSYK